MKPSEEGASIGHRPALSSRGVLDNRNVACGTGASLRYLAHPRFPVAVSGFDLEHRDADGPHGRPPQLPSPETI